MKEWKARTTGGGTEGAWRGEAGRHPTAGRLLQGRATDLGEEGL